MKKLNQKGVAHHLLLVVVVLVVVAVGYKVLTASHADAPTSTASSSSNAVGTAVIWSATQAQGGSNGQSSVPFNDIGTQVVSYLASGDTLKYPELPTLDETYCYDVYVAQPKSGTATGTFDFYSETNKKQVTLSSNNTNSLQQICVPPGSTSNKSLAYPDVTNASSPQNTVNLEVYRMILTSSPPSNMAGVSLADSQQGTAADTDIVIPATAGMAVDSELQNRAPSSVDFYWLGGPTTVDYLSPGQNLKFQLPALNETYCYEVYVEKPATGVVTGKFEFYSMTNHVTVSLSSAAAASKNPNLLSQVCVPPGTDSSYNSLSPNVVNLSSTKATLELYDLNLTTKATD